MLTITTHGNQVRTDAGAKTLDPEVAELLGRYIEYAVEIDNSPVRSPQLHIESLLLLALEGHERFQRWLKDPEAVRQEVGFFDQEEIRFEEWLTCAKMLGMVSKSPQGPLQLVKG